MSELTAIQILNYQIEQNKKSADSTLNGYFLDIKEEPFRILCAHGNQFIKSTANKQMWSMIDRQLQHGFTIREIYDSLNEHIVNYCKRADDSATIYAQLHRYLTESITSFLPFIRNLAEKEERENKQSC